MEAPQPRDIDGATLLQNVISKVEWAESEEKAHPTDADYWHGMAAGLRMVRAYLEEPRD